MKKAILLFLLILIIPAVYSLKNCERVLNSEDVPCSILNSWKYENACNTYTVSVYNETPTLLDIRTMADYGDIGKCNITFNYTAFGSYFLNFSSGDTMIITVEVDEDNQYRFYLISFIIFFILLILGYYFEIPAFMVLSGILLVMISVNLWINGFPNLDEGLLKDSVTVILAGAGFYLLLAPTIKWMEENF